jgi:hypothetical protein
MAQRKVIERAYSGHSPTPSINMLDNMRVLQAGNHCAFVVKQTPRLLRRIRAEQLERNQLAGARPYTGCALKRQIDMTHATVTKCAPHLECAAGRAIQCLRPGTEEAARLIPAMGRAGEKCVLCHHPLLLFVFSQASGVRRQKSGIRIKAFLDYNDYNS